MEREKEDRTGGQTDWKTGRLTSFPWSEWDPVTERKGSPMVLTYLFMLPTIASALVCEYDRKL